MCLNTRVCTWLRLRIPAANKPAGLSTTCAAVRVQGHPDLGPIQGRDMGEGDFGIKGRGWGTLVLV